MTQASGRRECHRTPTGEEAEEGRAEEWLSGGEGRPAEFLGELVDPALSFEVGFCFAELER
jgi:hypothetical protein